MIQQDSVKQVMELAKIAAEQGKTIKAQPNSPLAQLCQSSTLFGAPVVTSLENLDDVPAAISAASDNTDHNAKFDYFAKMIVQSAAGHLAFANNIVVAAITSTAKRAMASLGAVSGSTASQFNVVIKDVSPLLTIDAFVESVMKETTTTFNTPQKQLKLSAKTPQQLLELLKTGAGVFDDALVAWWNKKGDTFFVQLWENLFMSASEAFPERTYSLPEILADMDDGLDAAVFVLQIARRLAKDLPAESKLSKDDLEITLMELRQIAATTITRVLADFQSAEKNSIVVQSRNSLQKRVTVYGKVYRQWLAAGGKPEILFGLLIDGSGAATISALDLEKPKLLKRWEDFKTTTTTQHQFNQIQQFRSALRNAFYQDFAAATMEEQEYAKDNPSHATKVADLFEGMITDVVLSDKNDIYRTCTRLVCRGRFYYTDAEKILTSVDETTKANPDLSLEQANTVAAMEYITDYVSNQLRVE